MMYLESGKNDVLNFKERLKEIELMRGSGFKLRSLDKINKKFEEYVKENNISLKDLVSNQPFDMVRAIMGYSHSSWK